MAVIFTLCELNSFKAAVQRGTSFTNQLRFRAKNTCCMNTNLSQWQVKQTAQFATLFRVGKSLYRRNCFIQANNCLNTSNTRNASARAGRTRFEFDINSNVPRDTLIFAYKCDGYYARISFFSIFLTFTLLVQSVFTQLDSARLGIKDVDTPVEQRNLWHRAKSFAFRNLWSILSVTYVVAGIGIVFMAHLYVRRTVTGMWLLKGGEAIKTETYTYFGNRRQFTVPIEDTDFRTPRSGKGTNVSYKVKDHRMHYMLDKKDGTFHEPELFDFVICFARVFRRN